MTQRVLFDAVVAMAVLFAAVMVLHRHPVKSVLALVVSFFALAMAFVLLSAPFVAAIQVIVYAGAILVLFLFVLMLLNIPEEERGRDPRPIQRVLSGVAVVVFAWVFLSLLKSRGTAIPSAAATAPATGEVVPLARMLFSEYLLAFEGLSVLLLAALVGAFVLAQREKQA